MKKILVLLTALFIMVSCSLDNDAKPFDLEFLPILSVDTPEVVVPGQSYNFTVYYRRPNDCYFANGFDYKADGAIRTVALQAIVIEDSDCLSLDTAEMETMSFQFDCPLVYSNSAYLFRFYQGENLTSGEDTFLNVEIPVQQ
ncbi:MAG: hypothetical protein EOP54_31125 [Sphingobacteriales bacterium]|nr:MAG: hypothetical protein EOP54_31125 [Sphingobacteriales bacterium]